MNNSEVENLALEIADDSSTSLIECCGVSVTDKRGHLLWYEIDPNDELEGWEVSRAVRYLKRRGMLRVHPKNPNHVKPVRP